LQDFDDFEDFKGLLRISVDLIYKILKDLK